MVGKVDNASFWHFCVYGRPGDYRLGRKRIKLVLVTTLFVGGRMQISRRDFVKLAGAFGFITTLDLTLVEKAFAGNGLPKVIWLQGQGCSGCTVSLLNSINLATIDDLLINRLDMQYNSTLIAAAGDVALSGDGAYGITVTPGAPLDLTSLASQGFMLVVEGAIPVNAGGKFCSVGGDMTMLDAFDRFSEVTTDIIAVGTCASFGGVSKAAGGYTGALGVQDALASLGRNKPVINIPGCPMHPDWFVGTVLTILSGGSVQLDADKRPTAYFSRRIHDYCPFRHGEEADRLGQKGCLEELGCRGPATRADCFSRMWNSPAANTVGVNWCIGSGSPCTGCVQKGWPDAPYSPFFRGGDGDGDDD
jgi:hydrogenase small subunit